MKKKSPKPTDLILCQRYAAGNNSAGEALLSRHSSLVYSIVHKLCKHRFADIEDFAQVGRMGLLNAAKLFEDRGIRFVTYAYPAIRNAVYRELERESRWLRNQQTSEEDEINPEYHPPEPDIDSEMSFERLSPLQRVILRKRYGFDGEMASFNQISRTLGITPKYVSVLHDMAIGVMQEHAA